MKIQTQQLIPTLIKNIAPLYLVSGDDFLLVQEACDTIRKHTAAAGYGEREIFYIESGFNWEKFLSSANNSSIFGDRVLIELHLKSKLNDSGSKTLQNYAKKPSPDKILLIITNKLDAAQQKTSWFKAIDTHGIILPIWPIEPAQLPLWIANRLKQAGFKTDQQGIQLLADHISGNLLAAIQEIEKLRLLYGSGNLTNDQIRAAITDNSRFNVFNLIDAAMSNNMATVNRILDNLKNENTEPTIILWAITHELRSLINISFALKQGINVDQAMTQNNIWYGRKQLVKRTLSQYDLARLQNLLKYASNIELIIKGADNQHLLWHELRKIYLSFADNKTISLLSSPY